MKPQLKGRILRPKLPGDGNCWGAGVCGLPAPQGPGRQFMQERGKLLGCRQVVQDHLVLH